MDRDILRTITVGKIKVVITREYDDSPDTSWLGKYSNFREPTSEHEKLVHCNSRLVLDHHGIWRNSKGQIQPTPEVSYHSREYQYTWHDNGTTTVKDALAEHNRLEEINSGYICFYGVIAKVYLDGAEIGYSSVWGIESDSGNQYFRQVTREEGCQAVHEARRWMQNNGLRQFTAVEVSSKKGIQHESLNS